MLRGALAFSLTLVLFVLSGAPAAAGGATVQHINLSSADSCSSYSYGGNTYTYCATTTGEVTITSTPSGNWSGQAQATQTFTFSINGTVVSSDSSVIHVHILYGDNQTVLKEEGAHQSGSSTYGAVTCTYAFDLHFANGAIQYNNSTYVCN